MAGSTAYKTNGGSLTSCSGVCSGRGHPLWGCLLMPVVLVYNAVAIYLVPCFGVYFARIFGSVVGTFCCCICKACGWYYYKDEAWSGETALGDTDEIKAAEMAKTVEWVRADELAVVGKGKRMNLFHGEIEPADLCQGAVGDCWLVAAMAGMAEHPGAIRNCFLNTEYTDVGKYRLRLWDGRAMKWETVTVDDYFPVKKGTKECVYMQPNGGELWAILMEKAFAKFCGSYGALDGGWAVWAWHAMTGDNVLQFRSKGPKWKRRNMVFVGKEGKRRIGFQELDDDIDEEDFFGILLKYSSKRSVMGASMIVKEAEREEKMDDGLVAGHMYSILQVRRAGATMGMGGTKLLKLRNPWGTFEWKGAWSDGSKEWSDHPGIKREVDYKDTDDGTFWMEYRDFKRRFNTVDICNRTTKNDLRLDVNEDAGCTGPLVGCLGGCGAFWCCCAGLRTIYFGNQTSEDTETAAGCCTTV
mmetsp:Transcript_7006/g.17882  ORF Transcript_7006/g.17882 Transcript_7006/m.17882 type:complete len:470 (-) Transcript_7006:265-1674(-)